MGNRLGDHEKQIPPGKVSEGGVDRTTGSVTGAIAGAVLGAAGGPLGLAAGALVGAAVGSVAAAGRERPYHPEPWQSEHERLLHESEDDDWQ